MSEFQLFINSIKSGSDEEIENKFKIEFLEMEDENLWRPLHYACHYGRIGLVELLFSEQSDGNLVKDIDLLCKKNEKDTLKILITKQHNTNDQEKLKVYQFKHLTCMNCHIDIMKILSSSKYDIEASVKGVCQPIFSYSLDGHIDIIEKIIGRKCDINTYDKNGNQPIHLASENGHIDIVKILIENECDINATAKNGNQPIHLASKNGHIDIVKILIANKCDINATDKNGNQPIHLACKNGHIDIVKILIANKCDINATDKLRYRPINLACENGHIDIVKILIANKCDINASDKNGYQPIHLACENRHIDVVQLLIDNKCDINTSDQKGYRPIHLVCENGHIDIVESIIENKCKISSLTDDGMSTINIAREKKRQQIVDNENSIGSIVREMNMHFKRSCDHIFCRKNLEDELFKKGELIGSGIFGKVYKYKISNTNYEIVIKRTKLYCEDTKYIEGNINKYSSRIVHENIVRHFGALMNSGKLCIYMEYMPGGSLKNLIDKSRWIESSKVIKFSKQILEGIQFLHSQGIIHRDIKPDNMLLDHDETLKLIDFGLSKSLRPISIDEITMKSVTFCGTPNYLAPEIFLGEPYYFPADIWSTGASIIHMITGKTPYHWLPAEAAMFRIATTKKIEIRDCQSISKTMQSFIDDLLTPDQSKRPTAECLLKHSIFNW